MKNNTKIKTVIIDYVFYTIGAVIYAMSVDVFTAPNNIAPGGLTGIATMLNHLFVTPIGTTILILNIPLFIWGAKEIGLSFLWKTIFATVVTSIAIDVLGIFLPGYYGDTMLAALFGGVLSGFGHALIFMRGATTGGTDIIARLMNKRFPSFSLGKIILIADVVIIILAAVVYKSLESALYALISIFVSTKLIDAIIYGTNIGTGKMMFIISPKYKEISNGIMENIRRGVTRIKSVGGYSCIEGEVLLCAVRRQEVYKTYDVVRSIDPHAFIIVGDAGEITGEGFTSQCKTPTNNQKNLT